jgi:hypothetical protein
MKKLYFLLTVLLLAAPAFCAVDVNCTADGNVVTVTYDATADGVLPRAFGLDITVDNGATIEVLDYADPNFWVHPGSIVITDGDVTDEGSAVAPNTDPGALGGLGTGGVTIEMGSLYDGNDPCHTTGPDLSGVLLVFKCDSSGADANVIIAGNAARGNVVLETTDEATVNYGTCKVVFAEPECLKASAPEYAEWDAWGKPACWCYQRQCRGDASGTKLGFWVQLADLNILKSAWYKSDALLAGIPNGICADFNHAKLGFRVQLADLNILKTYWYKADALTPCCDADGDCVLDAGDKYNFWTN